MAKMKAQTGRWTAADIAALPAKQRDVLGQICLGNDGGHPRATLAALVRKELVEEITVEERDRLGVLRYKRYDVASVGVHMAWCYWASEQVSEDDAG